MFINDMKITHKIYAIIAVGIVLCVAFATIAVGIVLCVAFATIAVLYGQNQSDTYNEKVTPLDNLRKIQLSFREIEYRLAGVQASLVTSTASAEHLGYTLQHIDETWLALKPYLTSGEEMGNFDKGFKGFKMLSVKIKEAYYNEDHDLIAELYDEWLDFKPLIMKSIDHLAKTKKDEVHVFFDNNNHMIKKVSMIIVLISGTALLIFIFFALVIIRSIKNPINTVVKASAEVAQGDLTRTVNIHSKDEMGEMAMSLNDMILHLREAFRRINGAVSDMNAKTTALSSLSQSLLTGAREQQDKGDQIAAAG
ncbi:methyl-accepting chemotaxis protein, partial [bacterium]|nr:methyl-accepting chemotaxis protein [bacterium]